MCIFLHTYTQLTVTNGQDETQCVRFSHKIETTDSQHMAFWILENEARYRQSSLVASTFHQSIQNPGTRTCPKLSADKSVEWQTPKAYNFSFHTSS